MVVGVVVEVVVEVVVFRYRQTIENEHEGREGGYPARGRKGNEKRIRQIVRECV